MIVIYTTIGALGTILQCTPMASLWDPNVDGHCYNYPLCALINGILNVVMEVIVLALPSHAVWKLQLERKLKLQIIGILLLGVLSVFPGPPLTKFSPICFQPS